MPGDPPPKPTLVVAARSARLLAEAASRDGFETIALDCFGDLDTLRAVRQWLPIGGEGTAQTGRLDAARTLAALERVAREPGVVGWVAGSDFECDLALLEQGAARLPLIGTAPAAARRVRDPRQFFAALAAAGLAGPETRHSAPQDARGWLRKLANGSGGWHIRRADEEGSFGAAEAAPAAPEAAPANPAAPKAASGKPGAALAAYFQRELAGVPMSALFLANGSKARLVGCQELIVRPYGAHPFVYRGAIGPLAMGCGPMTALLGLLDSLSASFELRGLCSVDFILADERRWPLEINPRPSASMALYGELPLMRAHVEACLRGVLTRFASTTEAGAHGMHGSETVFARRAFVLSAAQSQALAARSDCHDLPAAGSRFGPGEPVCSVHASGQDAPTVRRLLAEKRQALRQSLGAQ